MARDCGCDDDYFARRRARTGKKSSAPDPHEAVYRSAIMKHYRSPLRRHPMPEAAIVCDPVSRSCGDRIQLFFSRDEAGLISDASYIGEGCSISIASASMLCDAVIGKNLNEICRLGIDVIDMLELEEEDEARGIFDAFADSGAEDMLSLWTLRDLGSRIPCALLSWKVLPGLVDKISP